MGPQFRDCTVGIIIVRIITLEDITYGAADVASAGWLDALVSRIRAQRSILDIIS